MKKFLAAAALVLIASATLQAAPTLGVTWRAAANATLPGVKILSVADASNAQELGLEVGDTVLAINNKVVKTGQEATDAVKLAKGKLVLLVKSVQGGLVEVKADIDEPTQGLVADPNAKAKYKNAVKVMK